MRYVPDRRYRCWSCWNNVYPREMDRVYVNYLVRSHKKIFDFVCPVCRSTYFQGYINANGDIYRLD